MRVMEERTTVHPTRVGTTLPLVGAGPGRRRFTPTARGDDPLLQCSRRRELTVHPHTRGDDAAERRRRGWGEPVHPHRVGTRQSQLPGLRARFTPTRGDHWTAAVLRTAKRFTPPHVETTQRANQI